VQDIYEIFQAFLAWRLPARQRGRLSGDALSSLSQDWEMWLAYLTDDVGGAAVRELRKTEGDISAQRSFLTWLKGQPGFSDNAVFLAGSQLVQCQGFQNWSELRHFTDPVALPHDCAVNGLFLLGRSEQDPGIVKSLIADFGPIVNEGEQRGKLLPLNFSLCSIDEEAWLALEEARHCALGIFGLRGVVFWAGYVTAGDFLPLTLYRLARLLFALPMIRAAFQERNIYLRINTRTGAAVAGPSLALAACLATVLAPANLPGKAYSKFLSRFLPKAFAGTVGCAVTGKLKHGHLLAVDGIQHKLDALREASDIRRAIVPLDNARSIQSKQGGPILDMYVPPVAVSGRRRILTALWDITPIRKTWLFLNIALVLGTYWGLATLPDWLETHYYRPFAISSIRTTSGEFRAPVLFQKGIRVRGNDKLMISIFGHEGDGLASLSASCVRGSTGSEHQSLRDGSDQDGDWRSEVTTPIKNGSASIDFRHNTENVCASLSLAVVHRGREVIRRSVPVSFDGE
jgi:hypothetical protein